ncbi:MAG: ankyrin repeat domain-containing protein [Deltaproteobacteria bacterium]|nr:ankyrin repeat domain-containing protein [Deltaproteobacteria bacterium]
MSRRPAAASAAPAAPPAGFPAPPPPWWRRWPVWLAVGFGLRLAVALAAFLYAGHVNPANPTRTMCFLMLGPDGDMYHTAAVDAARLLTGAAQSFTTHLPDRYLNFPLILAGLYALGGPNPLWAAGLNAVAFTLAGLAAWSLARSLGQPRARAGWLALAVALWPPSLAYAALPLKDSLFVLASLGFLAGLAPLVAGSRRRLAALAGWGALVLAAAYLLMVIRVDFIPVLPLVAGLAAVLGLARGWFRRSAALAWPAPAALALVLLAAWLAGHQSPAQWIKPWQTGPQASLTPAPAAAWRAAWPGWPELGPPAAWAAAAAPAPARSWPLVLNQVLDRRVDYAASGGVTLVPTAHEAPDSLTEGLALMPPGLANLLVHPLPWERMPPSGGILWLGMAGFAALWLLVLPGMAWGAGAALRQRPSAAVLVLAWGLGLGLAATLMVVNFGTIFRQRDLAILPLLLLWSPAPYVWAVRLAGRLLPVGWSRRRTAALLAGLALATLLAPVPLLSRAPSPLFRAVENGDQAAVAGILAAHPEDAQATYLGRTPLHLVVVAQRVEFLDPLLAAGAAVDAPDAVGNTPLHLAALLERPVLARLLLARGADPRAVNRLGQNPLHMAAYGGRPFTAAELLAGGADPAVQDRAGYTPRELALRRGKIRVEALLPAGR